MSLQPPPQPGQLLARGICRHLSAYDFRGITEFVPRSGLRVDVMAVGPKGELWVIECKSSRADYMTDSKWQGYLEFCDRFYWAVDADFPREILPEGTGIFLADAYGAEMLRDAPEHRLAAARRKSLMIKIARTASERLLRATDNFQSGDAYV